MAPVVKSLLQQRDSPSSSYSDPNDQTLRPGDIAGITIGVVTAITGIIILLMKAWKFWSRRTAEAETHTAQTVYNIYNMHWISIPFHSTHSRPQPVRLRELGAAEMESDHSMR